MLAALDESGVLRRLLGVARVASPAAEAEPAVERRSDVMAEFDAHIVVKRDWSVAVTRVERREETTVYYFTAAQTDEPIWNAGSRARDGSIRP